MPNTSMQEKPGGFPGVGKEEVNFDDLMEAGEQGLSMQDMSSEFGISVPTLSRRVAELTKMATGLVKYRAVQALELTALQARVLSAITQEKIDDAPLKDLVGAFKILKDKELVMEGKPSEIKGLIGLLVQLEKEDLTVRTAVREEQILDVTPVVVEDDGVPKL